MAKTKEERHKEIHQEALHEFSAIQDVQRDQRIQMMEDRRFVTIAGAQWEGDDNFAKQFENKPHLEVNMIQLSIIRIYNEYRNNRITVNFEPTDGAEHDDLSDTLDDLYRDCERRSVAVEAYDNCFDEGVSGGMGAYRFDVEEVDEFDPENDKRRIVINPITDADSSVFFGLESKRQDKSNAKRCFVLTAWQRDDYEREFDDDPSSWPTELDQGVFDWYDTEQNIVYVAEYFRVEDKTKKLFIYKLISGEEKTFTEAELEEEEEVLNATGAEFMRERKIKERAVHWYIMSGSKILEDRGIIAGKNIPIVPFYGKRAYVNNVEVSSGHARLPKDMQRLTNMQVSFLAEISATGGYEKPIVTPEQIAGHREQWEADNLENYPYLVLNTQTDVNGNPINSGPIGFTKAPNVPPAMAALFQLTDKYTKELLGNQEQGEKIVSNISDDAIGLVQEQLQMQTFIYMSNFAKSMARGGEIWKSMAKDTLTEQGRKVKGITSQGTSRQIVLRDMTLDKKTKAKTIVNDLRKADHEVYANVGPSSSTARKSTNKTLLALLPLVQDPTTADVISSNIMMNMEGEGMSDLRDYFRDKLVRSGAIKPNDDEQKQLKAEAENQQPSPQDQLLLSEAQKSQAGAAKAEADTIQSMEKAKNLAADTEKKQAETASIDASVERDDTDQVLGALERHNQ